MSNRQEAASAGERLRMERTGSSPLVGGRPPLAASRRSADASAPPSPPIRSAASNRRFSSWTNSSSWGEGDTPPPPQSTTRARRRLGASSPPDFVAPRAGMAEGMRGLVSVRNAHNSNISFFWEVCAAAARGPAYLCPDRILKCEQKREKDSSKVDRIFLELFTEYRRVLNERRKYAFSYTISNVARSCFIHVERRHVGSTQSVGKV